MKTGKHVIGKGQHLCPPSFDKFVETEPVTLAYDGVVLTLAQHNEKEELQYLELTNGQLKELKEILSR